MNCLRKAVDPEYRLYRQQRRESKGAYVAQSMTKESDASSSEGFVALDAASENIVRNWRPSKCLMRRIKATYLGKAHFSTYFPGKSDTEALAVDRGPWMAHWSRVTQRSLTARQNIKDPAKGPRWEASEESSDVS